MVITAERKLCSTGTLVQGGNSNPPPASAASKAAALHVSPIGFQILSLRRDDPYHIPHWPLGQPPPGQTCINIAVMFCLSLKVWCRADCLALSDILTSGHNRTPRVDGNLLATTSQNQQSSGVQHWTPCGGESSDIGWPLLYPPVLPLLRYGGPHTSWYPPLYPAVQDLSACPCSCRGWRLTPDAPPYDWTGGPQSLSPLS